MKLHLEILRSTNQNANNLDTFKHSCHHGLILLFLVLFIFGVNSGKISLSILRKKKLFVDYRKVKLWTAWKKNQVGKLQDLRGQTARPRDEIMWNHESPGQTMRVGRSDWSKPDSSIKYHGIAYLPTENLLPSIHMWKVHNTIKINDIVFKYHTDISQHTYNHSINITIISTYSCNIFAILHKYQLTFGILVQFGYCEDSRWH